MAFAGKDTASSRQGPEVATLPLSGLQPRPSKDTLSAQVSPDHVIATASEPHQQGRARDATRFSARSTVIWAGVVCQTKRGC